MSSFTSPLIGEILDDGNHIILHQPFRYWTDLVHENHPLKYINVPVGFKSDFASIPEWAQWIIPKQGKYSKAAVLHDYLYFYGIGSKDFADRLFLEAMEILGVPLWKSNLMYIAVKYGGKGNYKNYF